LEGISSNKIRSLLTMLGIIIGIGSVIAIVTISDAMAATVSDSLTSLGVTNILVWIQNKNSEDMGTSYISGLTEDDYISDEMVERYSRRFQSRIETVSLSNVRGAGRARSGSTYANVNYMGANEGYGMANNVNILQGRFLRDNDLASQRYVAVVSDKLVEKIFSPNQDVLGKEIRADISGFIQTFTIVGVYKYEAGGDSLVLGAPTATEADKDLRTLMYIPITTLNTITSARKGYTTVTVQARDRNDVSKLADDTKAFFNTFYENNTKFEITASSMYESYLTAYSDTMDNISLTQVVIGTISLIVGGIGIMNIMLVSVTERTKEIGMRKAIGARDASIQVQFIVEAVILSGIGGVIGAVMGVIFGYGGSVIIDRPTLPNVDIIIISVLFSMLIGVFFGYYPANKAAKLDPVEALRYE